MPAVFIERTPPPSASSLVSTVTSNLRRGTIDAVTHTANAGRHRIGFVGPEMEAHETGVYEGYLEGLHRAGLPLLPDAAITTADLTMHSSEVGLLTSIWTPCSPFAIRPPSNWPNSSGLPDEGSPMT